MRSLATSLFLAAAFIANAQCYTVSSITYAPDPLNAGTLQTLADDQLSQRIPIGFSFCFYGASHDSLLIASNGYVIFDTYLAGGYALWPISAAAPSTSLPKNSIMIPYQDLSPPLGGTIKYALYGNSPSRRFVVSYDSVPMYTASTPCDSIYFTGQVALYETTNVIEIFIHHKDMCTSWNAGAAIQGIQNGAGNMAAVVNGRNFPTQWTTTDDAYRFTPSCNVCMPLSTPDVISDSRSFILYPNPGTGKFIIENKSGVNGQLYIYNSLGSLLHTSNAPDGMEVDLEQEAPGLYHYRVVWESGTVTGGKLVIQK